MAYNFKFFFKRHIKNELNPKQRQIKIPKLNKNFFGFKGAIDRSTFGVFTGLVFVLYLFLYWLLQSGNMPGPVIPILLILFHFIFFVGAIQRRMADIEGEENGLAASYVLMMMILVSIPLLNFGFYFYLLFRKGLVSSKEEQ